MPARTTLIVSALALVAVIAGCGGDDQRATTPVPTGATNPPTTVADDGSGTGTTTGPGSDGPGGSNTPPESRAGSRTAQQAALDGGRSISYTLVLPDGYRPGRRYPVLVAFPPGGQGQAEVDALLDKWWAAEGRKRGWIVVSPVAPASGPFYSGSADLVPAFLDRIAAVYPPDGGRFHLAGVSNGGLSAFRVALDSPKRFASLLVAPGFPPDPADRRNLKALKDIPVAMYVGENDAGWREPSGRTVAELKRLGGTATLTVSPGEDHILTKVTAAQLYDVLDAAR